YGHRERHTRVAWRYPRRVGSPRRRYRAARQHRKERCADRLPSAVLTMRRSARGFSLIELVVTIALSAIVVGFMAMFMTAPVDAFAAHERRAALADSADNAVRMLDYDIRSALPDSVRYVRTGSIVTLELLSVEEVARYRKTGEGGGPTEEFNLGAP